MYLMGMDTPARGHVPDPQERGKRRRKGRETGSRQKELHG